MADLCLDDVAAAAFSVLNVASMTALLAGGWHDSTPKNISYPFGEFSLSDDATQSGLGTKPGQGLLSVVSLRLSVFSKDSDTKRGMKEAHDAMKEAIRLLSVTEALRSALASSGYRVAGTEPFYDGSQSVPGSVVAGESVNELAGNFRLYLEEV